MRRRETAWSGLSGRRDSARAQRGERGQGLGKRQRVAVLLADAEGQGAAAAQGKVGVEEREVRAEEGTRLAQARGVGG